MIQDRLKTAITEALMAIGVVSPKVTLEHPADIAHGDYSTSVALAYSRELKLAPRIIADKIVAHLTTLKLDDVAAIEIAGPGFINIRLTRSFFSNEIVRILKEGKNFGTNTTLKGKKIVIDYTNPNPFKVFHIGHLMANAIGEALSRIIEAHGAEVVRVNYQGDVGLHVAKAMWGMLQKESEFPKDDATLEDMINYISKAYVVGAAAYEGDGGSGANKTAKEEIIIINKMIFDRSNPKLMKMYEWGRKVSLLNFEVIYRKLGTKFDHYFFESEVAADGVAIVQDFLKRGVFTDSEGAIVFKGEPYGLHTRVFITSQNLPTYEAKEVGLTRLKFDRFNPDMSIVVTANEQNDYFRVVLKALSIMFPYMAGKMKHVNHGMLRLSTGDGASMKMGSRKGNVITGESLLSDVSALALEKMKDRDFGAQESAKNQAIIDVSVGAIKYSILKQAPGGDIIYDFEKSISFEGDSGPYLQYACVRARSLIMKAEAAKIKPFSSSGLFGKKKANLAAIPAEVTLLEKILYRYPEVVERAGQTYEPHHIVTYLIELSAAFNNFYANSTIVDATDKAAPYRVALTEAFTTVMSNGLNVLGIRVPVKM
ncbi:MAG: hypothetical protein RIT04_620 [Candidatus Parcubacteria bacterium]|jgi:arginyl-tRNA synthetase